jgi:tetratricopeptide (TPR) repeat protein
VGLFGFNAEKKLAKAKELLTRGLAYDARLAFEEIIMRGDVDPGIAGQARGGWREARGLLVANQLEQAAEHLAAGDREQARESCLAAIEQAGEDLDSGEARALLARVEKELGKPTRTLLEGIAAPARPAEPDAAEGEEEEEGEATGAGQGEEGSFDQDPEALFEVHLGALPDEQADRLRSFGPEFRDGYLALQEGRVEEALECFEAAPSSVAADPYFKLEMALVLHQLRSDGDALEMIEGLDLDGPAGRRRTELQVSILDRLDRAEEAEQQARALWEISGHDTPSSLLYGELLLLHKEFDRALEVVRPLVHAGRPQPEIDRLVARAYRATGRTEDARQLLERALEVHFQGGMGLHATGFPVWAAWELLDLYIAIEEEPRAIRAIANHLMQQDPESSETVRKILERHARTLAGEPEPPAPEA